MGKKVLICWGLVLVTNLFAQSKDIIVLNSPDIDRGLTVMSALSHRASVVEFDTTSISHQDMSDLLWAANGINRPETGKRTAPSAMNAQDIDVFIFNETGVYVYNAQSHILELVVKGDNRGLFSEDEAATNPPIICLLVSDISRFGTGDNMQMLEWAAIDAGIVAQNILLFCTSIDMTGRPRSGMNRKLIKELLGLKESQLPLLNIPVSYKKK